VYHGAFNEARALRRGPGLAGIFGCDVNAKDFEAENKVAVYPGKLNVWLLARRKGKGPTIEKVTSDFITKPMNTSWFSNNVNVGGVVKLPNDPTKIQLSMVSHGLRVQNTTVSKLTYPVHLGTDLEFYQVLFYPPADAPLQVAWPLVGCAEDATWALSSALSDIEVATGKPSPGVNQSIDTSSPADIEKQRQDSLSFLSASRKMGMDGGISMTTWVLLGSGLLAATFLYGRAKR
jgi:hypothetical protein